MASSQPTGDVSMELKMNFATGYLLCEERKKVREKTNEQSALGEKKFVLKTVEWIETEVYAKMKKYEEEQNEKDVREKETEKETEAEAEYEEMEESEEETAQRKWIDDAVQAMVTDYEYEAATMRRVLMKTADQALQVIIHINLIDVYQCIECV